MNLPAALNYLQPRVFADLVRIGSARDGGYLVPRSALAGIDAVLSFGVSVDWNFEKQLRDMHPDIDIHCYDHTVRPRRFLQYVAKGVRHVVRGKGSVAAAAARAGVWRDYGRFFRGRTVHFRERVFNRREKANDATVEAIFARIPGRRHVLVKADIEGAEYRVVPGLLAHVDAIDVLIVEFHDTEPLRLVFEHQVGLLLQHFVVAHVHGNNFRGRAADGLPDVLEITFVSKRLGVPAERRDRLPLPGLDAACNPDADELALEFAAG